MKFHIDYVLRMTNGVQYGVKGRYDDNTTRGFTIKELYNAVLHGIIELDSFIIVKENEVKK